MLLSTKRLIVYIVTFLALPTLLYGQDSDNQTSQGQGQGVSLSFPDISSTIGEGFYIDQVGLQLLESSPQLEEYVDPDTYTLGPQDVLAINTEGSLSLTARGLVVNAQGYIVLPSVGEISVRELTISQAKEKIQSVFEDNFQDIDIELSLERPRVYQVHVIGDVPYPGKYHIPAGSRIDFAIYPALFETKSNKISSNTSFQYESSFLTNSDYSLRNIKIIHKNNKTDTADLLSYFREGDKSSNPFIQDGDVIHLQKTTHTSPVISISGAVTSPAVFEFKNSDSISDLIEISGGYLTEADSSRVFVYRNTPENQEKITVTAGDLETFVLQKNDRVVVPYQSNYNEHESVWVYGEVAQPGNYALTSKLTTLGDLLEISGGLTDKALPHGAYIIRNPSRHRRVPPSIDFNTQELKRSSDQLVQGFDYLDLESKLNTENRLFVNLDQQEALEKIRLVDGDRLFIPKDYHSVIVFGQINNPGYYNYKDNLTAQDYINKAGGFTIAAETDRVFVIKAGSKAWKNPGETNIESGDIIYVDRTPYDELNAKRTYQIQLENLKRSKLQTVLTAVSTITAVITTVVAIRR